MRAVLVRQTAAWLEAKIELRSNADLQKLSRERMNAVLLCILLIGAVMGSIYGGVASVTEAAAVGCIGALFIAAVRNNFNWSVLSAAMLGAMTTVGTIIWLVLGAVSFVGIFNGSDSHAYNVVLINFFQNSVMCDSLVVIRELLKRDRNYQIFFMKILWQRFFRGIRESFLPRM